MSLILKDYQLEAIDFLLKTEYALLGLKMGTGKSLICIETFKQCGLKRLLVICPSYLVFNWENEFKKWAPEKKTIAFYTGKSVKRPTEFDVAIISYDLSTKHEVLFEWAEMVVCDEAHYLNNTEAKRTSTLHKFIYEYSMKRLILSTGTPIKNRVKELYSLLALCNYNPKFKGNFLAKFSNYVDFSEYFSFRREYKIEYAPGRFKNVVKWEGMQRVDELKKWLKPVYFNRKIEDVAALEVNKVLINNSDDLELLAAFNKFLEGEGSTDIAAKSKAALEKVPFTIKFIDSLLEQGEGPIVLFSDHVESTKALAKYYSTVPVYAETAIKVRNCLVQDFQSGKLKVLCATVKTLSAGVNLTESSHVVFNDLPWTPGDIDQATYRINRIGQKKKVCYVHFIMGSPQDSYIYDVVNEKREISDTITK